ncbi:DMT family transporter [Desulfosporosinus burensis]
MAKTFDPLPHLMLIIVAFIFSTNFIVGKTLVEFPPLFIGTIRFSVAGLFFIPILFFSKTRLPKGRIWITIMVMGLTGVAIFNPLVYWGLHYTTSINATLINSFNPMTIAFLGYFLLKEKLTRSSVLGLLISFLGIAFIVGRGSLLDLLKLQFNIGDLLVFSSTFIWGFYTVLIRKVSNVLNPMQSTSLAVMAGLIFMIPGSLVENIWLPIPNITLVAALSLLYLGIFPSVVAFLFWNTGVSKVGPIQASAYYNLIPVFNVMLAYYILNEKLLSYHIIGGMFIILGIVITSIGQYKTQMRNRVN